MALKYIKINKMDTRQTTNQKKKKKNFDPNAYYQIEKSKAFTRL